MSVDPVTSSIASSADVFARLAQTIASRAGADPAKSYVAKLMAKAPDAALKKVGEEAAEFIMACKDADAGKDKNKIVYEAADLWFHSLVALAHYGLSAQDVLAELARREGLSGIAEKAARPD